MKLAKLAFFSLTSIFTFSVLFANPVQAATTKKTTPQKTATKSAPKPVAKPQPKKTAKTEAASLEGKVKINLGPSWKGVITGVENAETFYLKQYYKYRYGELTIKVGPETKFQKNGVQATIKDFRGGDYIEIRGPKVKGEIQANIVNYLSSQYRNL